MRRINVAIIGAGFMGEFHARAYTAANALYGIDLGVQIVVSHVVDAELARAHQLATRWGIANVGDSWREAIESDSIDIVDICTPPTTHSDIALAAMEAGRIAYCEKPVGRGLEETALLAERARSLGVETFVGFNYRYIPALQLAAELVGSGAIGDVVHATIFKDSDSMADPSRDGWRFYSDMAGAGSLADVGSHVFDLARLLVGEVRSVSGRTDTVIKRRGDSVRDVDTDDVWMALAVFDSGATGIFRGSRVLQGNKADMRIEIYGRKGSIRWSQQSMNELQVFEPRDDGRDGYRCIRMGPSHHDHGRFVPVRGHSIGFADLKTMEVGHLMRQIAAEEPLTPNFHDAYRVALATNGVARGEWTEVSGAHHG